MLKRIMSSLSVHNFLLVVENEQLTTAILRSCRGASTLNKEWEAVPHSFRPLHNCVGSQCNQDQGYLGMEPWSFAGVFQENGKTGSASKKAAYCFLQLFIMAGSKKIAAYQSPGFLLYLKSVTSILAILFILDFQTATKISFTSEKWQKKKAALGRHCQNPHKLKCNLNISFKLIIFSSNIFPLKWA